MDFFLGNFKNLNIWYFPKHLELAIMDASKKISQT